MKTWPHITPMVKVIMLGPDGGSFTIAAKDGLLRIIASIGGGWDHVSVSHEHRIPTWTEMELVAKIFFKANEYAVQFHVPPTRHINTHPNVLHWWRHQDITIPIPPTHFV